MAEAPVEHRRWTRAEYDRLVEIEFLGPDDKIELLGGYMIVREPKAPPRAACISMVYRALADAFGNDWHIRTVAPLALDDDSEPEPAACVVPGDPMDYLDAHPARAALIVEASLVRLAFDREHKGSLYARAGIADYWIVNIPERRLEIYRDPMTDAASPFAWRYGRGISLGPDQTISPLAAPSASISVRDLVP
jgi:Uma2 family endonuclease